MISAFYLFAFALLFLAGPKSRPGESLRTEAAVLMSVVFFSATLQKINSEYLGGQEFSPTGSFMIYLRSWTPLLNGPTAQMLASPLAYLSIAVELIIGIGLLLRPVFFSQIAILFVLSLSLLHPPVLYVYFFLLPLFILVSGEASRLFTKYLGSNSFRVPIIMAVVIRAMVYETGAQDVFPYFTYAMAVVLLAVHISSILKNWKSRTDVTDCALSFQWRPRSLVLPTIAVLSFVGSHFFLPSPLGFNMFSASRFKTPFYTLSISDPQACAMTRSRWAMTIVTDTSLDFAQDGSCTVRFPTKSGLMTIVDEVAKTYPNSKFDIARRDQPLF